MRFKSILLFATIYEDENEFKGRQNKKYSPLPGVTRQELYMRYKYLLVPVNIPGVHWYLLVVEIMDDTQTFCIHKMDSYPKISLKHGTQARKNLGLFIAHDFNDIQQKYTYHAENDKDLPIVKQHDSFTCGMHMLACMQRVLQTGMMIPNTGVKLADIIEMCKHLYMYLRPREKIKEAGGVYKHVAQISRMKLQQFQCLVEDEIGNEALDRVWICAVSDVMDYQISQEQMLALTLNKTYFGDDVLDFYIRYIANGTRVLPVGSKIRRERETIAKKSSDEEDSSDNDGASGGDGDDKKTDGASDGDGDDSDNDGASGELFGIRNATGAQCFANTAVQVLATVARHFDMWNHFQTIVFPAKNKQKAGNVKDYTRHIGLDPNRQQDWSEMIAKVTGMTADFESDERRKFNENFLNLFRYKTKKVLQCGKSKSRKRSYYTGEDMSITVVRTNGEGVVHVNNKFLKKRMAEDSDNEIECKVCIKKRSKENKLYPEDTTFKEWHDGEMDKPENDPNRINFTKWGLQNKCKEKRKTWDEALYAPKALLLSFSRNKYSQETHLATLLNYNVTLEHSVVMVGEEMELAAVVLHHGKNVNSGHYTCLVKHVKEWYEINDETVKPIIGIDAHLRSIEEWTKIAGALYLQPKL